MSQRALARNAGIIGALFYSPNRRRRLIPQRPTRTMRHPAWGDFDFATFLRRAPLTRGSFPHFANLRPEERIAPFAPHTS